MGERADRVTRCGRDIRWVRKLGSMGIVILSAGTVLCVDTTASTPSTLR